MMANNSWTIPDSELCRKATDLVAQVSPDFLRHHCLRTFIFGQQIGQLNELKFDTELFYLSAILHDLGLTEDYMGEQRFEVEGADAAKQFVREHGLSEEKAEVVWDAIALHTSLGIASRKQPEIALVHLGASVDVVGIGVEALNTEFVHQVFETYPRLNLSNSLSDLLVEQVKRKPKVVPLTWLADVGRCCIHGFSCPSYLDMINASPFKGDQIKGD